MMIGMRTRSVYCPCTALTGPCPVLPQALKAKPPHGPPGLCPRKSLPRSVPLAHCRPGSCPNLLGRLVTPVVLGA